ncbi:acetyltransferase [Microlunatus panaciterrae]|uniref:Sugar O-acyltransferase (Sialic acid O-acetyltransferase NeuD family) n=1 Tax=Microlunatus panaciterrae TaxID=400768 RepID=A0ABS2RHK7_9ACTN|nr:NeuD/PglB/VioB family sugar acetyltransferase [Microlunatus panaciterrae]MBM7798486.1 sugar O-acyltransferase (sialic acid O-acetyltransferase NeuD family) [Microlunatus panaciterrae]
MKRDLVLIAASGLAREVMSVVRAAGRYHLLGILDDATLAGVSIEGVPVLGPVASAAELEAQLLVCVGRGQSRRAIVERLEELGVTEDRYATILDPTVHLAATCIVGAGSILLAHTAVTADVTVGRHVVVMPNSTITHDDAIDDYATLCAGVSLGGAVSIGSAAYLGMNASVRQNLTVGPESVLGMGAALLSDLPAGETWVGVPAAPHVATSPSAVSATRLLRANPAW